MVVTTVVMTGYSLQSGLAQFCQRNVTVLQNAVSCESFTNFGEHQRWVKALCA